MPETFNPYENIEETISTLQGEINDLVSEKTALEIQLAETSATTAGKRDLLKPFGSGETNLQTKFNPEDGCTSGGDGHRPIINIQSLEVSGWCNNVGWENDHMYAILNDWRSWEIKRRNEAQELADWNAEFGALLEQKQESLANYEAIQLDMLASGKSPQQIQQEVESQQQYDDLLKNVKTGLIITGAVVGGGLVLYLGYKWIS